MLRSIAIIPARGGSKGIPRKNTKLLNGKPLIAYAIEQAKKSKYLDRVIVSTEDKEIAEISKNYGAEIIKRPKKLATDSASTESVLKHSIDFLKSKGYKTDIIVLLEPTTPLREDGIIDKAIEKLISSKADSVITVSKDYGYFWKQEKNKYKRINNPRYLPRQKRKPLFKENMQVYASKANIISNTKRIGKKVELIETFEPIMDLHDEFDWRLAELLAK